MANPIKTSDLYQDDGALKKLIAELEEVNSKLEGLRQNEAQNASRLEAQIKKLNATTSSQRDEIEATSKQADEINRRYQKYTESLSDNAVKIAALKNAQRTLNQVNKLEAKLLTEKEGSYNRLSAQYSINKIRLNQMSAEERKNTKEGQELVKTTNAIYQEMKQLQEETGKHTLSVGDYTKSIRDASKDQQRLAKELEETVAQYKAAQKSTKLTTEVTEAYETKIQELTDQIDNLGTITGKTSEDFESGFTDSLLESEGALGDVARGVQGVGRSFKALLSNPIVLVLATLAGVLITLFNAFTKSEKGAQLMAKVTGIVNGVMSQLVDIAVKVAEGIEWAFSNPQEALRSFGKLLIDQVVNRLKGVIDLAIAVGETIYQSITFNFDEAEKAAKRAGTAFTQVLTGLDAQQQNEFAEAVREATKEIVEETNAFIKLEEAKRSVRRANRALVRSIEELTTAEEVSQAIADDTTKSFKEREEAAERARQATEQRAAKEIQLAKNSLSLLNTEIDLRRANGEQVEDLLDRQLDAYREVAAAERNLLVTRINNERTLAELQQDRLERDLDILIDGFDNQKTINERRLNDERLTLAERRNIFEETVRLSDDSFAKQIETIQQFTGIQVNANELIAESDAVALNQKIRSLGLSEIIEGRLLEIVRERRIAVQDLSDAEIELAEKQRDARMKALEQAQSIAKSDFELTQRTEEEKAELVLQQKRDMLAQVQQLNSQFSDTLPPIDTSQLEASIRTLESELSQARKATALESFDQQQSLAQSEFDLLRTSERKKTEFRLNAEKERLQKILQLNEQFGSDLTESQLQTIKNQIARIDTELNRASSQVNDIYDVFGFDLDDETRSALNESVGYAKELIGELTAARQEAANQAVQAANEQVAASQRALDIEIQNRNAGYAHSVETAENELASAKRNQERALKEQRKAQRAQNAIQTLEQTSNLVTASAKIWSSFAGLGPAGPFLAIGAIAAMWGSFVAAKIRASQLAKKQFGEGGLEILGGGSHASGNDTYLGFQSEGRPAFGQKGEAVAIIPTKQTRKYRKVLPDLVNSLRRGTFEHQYGKINGQASSDSEVMVVGAAGSQSSSADISNLESDVSAIRKQGEKQYHRDEKGNLVERYKNLTRIYVQS